MTGRTGRMNSGSEVTGSSNPAGRNYLRIIPHGSGASSKRFERGTETLTGAVNAVFHRHGRMLSVMVTGASLSLKGACAAPATVPAISAAMMVVNTRRGRTRTFSHASHRGVAGACVCVAMRSRTPRRKSSAGASGATQVRSRRSRSGSFMAREGNPFSAARQADRQGRRGECVSFSSECYGFGFWFGAGKPPVLFVTPRVRRPPSNFFVILFSSRRPAPGATTGPNGSVTCRRGP